MELINKGIIFIDAATQLNRDQDQVLREVLALIFTPNQVNVAIASLNNALLGIDELIQFHDLGSFYSRMENAEVKPPTIITRIQTYFDTICL